MVLNDHENGVSGVSGIAREYDTKVWLLKGVEQHVRSPGN
jgi:hypothetical protein